MLFNLCRSYANYIPGSWGIRIVDVPSDNFIWAKKRPPHGLSSFGNSQCHGFGYNRGTRKRLVCQGRHKIEEIFVRESRGPRKGNCSSQLRTMNKISQCLCYIHYLRMCKPKSIIRTEENLTWTGRIVVLAWFNFHQIGQTVNLLSSNRNKGIGKTIRTGHVI